MAGCKRNVTGAGEISSPFVYDDKKARTLCRAISSGKDALLIKESVTGPGQEAEYFCILPEDYGKLLPPWEVTFRNFLDDGTTRTAAAGSFTANITPAYGTGGILIIYPAEGTGTEQFCRNSSLLENEHSSSKGPVKHMIHKEPIPGQPAARGSASMVVAP